MPLINSDDLFDYIKKILEAANAPLETAALVARMLVDGNLNGHNSHGAIRIKQYIDAINSCKLDPQASPVIEIETPSYASINGNKSFGQIAGVFTK